MYHIGDYIVKSTNGVCEVKDIVNPDFVSDHSKLYYELIPLSDQNAVLYIPVDKTDGVLRAVMTEQEAQELIDKIPAIHETSVKSEKERERSYKAAVSSTDPERVVGIMKLLHQRKKVRQEQGKKTTTVDERYYGIAEKLLYSELELAMHKTREEIHEQIRESSEQE